MATDHARSLSVLHTFKQATLCAAARRPFWYARMRSLYELTCEFASLAPPTAEQQALFGALRTNEEDTRRFFGVVAGTVPADESSRLRTSRGS
jgi:hypothetical protein